MTNRVAWYVIKGYMDRFVMCDECKGNLGYHLLRYVHETEPNDVVCSNCGKRGDRILAKDWIPLIGIKRDR